MPTPLRLPTPTAMQKLFQVVTQREPAEQLINSFVENANKLGLTDKVQAVIDDLKRFNETIKRETAEVGKSPWTGNEAGVLFTRLQRYTSELSNVAALALRSSQSLYQKPIIFAFALNEGSQLQQGFSSEGQFLGGNSEAQFQQLFDAWITSRGMCCGEKGVVCKLKSDGKMGDPVKPSAFSEAIRDDKTGFEAFVRDKTEAKLANFKVVEQKYAAQAESEAPSSSGRGTR